jgi:hypothetical protein
MMNIKELYRQAIVFLMERDGKQIRDVAKAGGVSERQVQYVIGGKGDRGFGAGTAQKIAASFGYTFNEILTIGQSLSEGRIPPEVISTNKSPNGLYQSATTTNGVSYQSGRDLNVGADSDISAQDKELITLLLKYGNQAIKQELLTKLRKVQRAVEGK